MLTIDCKLRIRNVRLELIRNLSRIIAVCVAILNFVVFASLVVEHPVTGVVNTRVAGTENLHVLNEETNRTAQSPLCTEPNRHAYWPEPTGPLRYDNFSCIKVCHKGQTGPKCISQYRLSFDDNSESSMIVTAFKERALGSTNLNATEPDLNYFVPASNALSVEIMYTLKLGDTIFNSFHDTSTSVLRSDGTEWKNFHVNQHRVEISLPDLFALAGTNLDAPQPDVGRNYFPHARDSSGPVSRLAGMDLRLEVHCRFLQAVFGSKYEIQCTMRVRKVSNFMVTFVRLESASLRLYHGIKLTGSVSGSHLTWSFNALLINLSTVITLLHIPDQLVIFFAMWALGHLSRIYRAAAHREFNIEKECAAMSLRLIAHSFTFSEVQSQMAKNCAIEDGILDDQSMTRMWTKVIKRHIPDPSSAGQMVSFFMHQIVSNFKSPPLSKADYKRNDLFHVVTENIKALAADIDYEATMNNYFTQESQNQSLNMENFQSALCSADPMSFDSIVRLFDQNRPVGRMESFFTPVHLRICMEKAKHDARMKAKQREEESVLTVKKSEQYTCARHQIIALREELQAMKQHISQVEGRLSKLIGTNLSKQESTASNYGPASSFASRVELDRNFSEMLEVVDRRFKMLQEELRILRSEVSAVAARAFGDIGSNERAQSPHQVGGEGGCFKRFPSSPRRAPVTDQPSLASTDYPAERV